jgi:hypothetical protein
VNEQANRRAVGQFTPLNEVNLAEFRDILVLGGMDVGHDDVTAVAARGQPLASEETWNTIATDPRLAACVGLVRGAEIRDDRVRRVVANEFRMIRDYHRDLRLPLSYDLQGIPVEEEEALYELFRCVHAMTDICCVVAPESYSLARMAYGHELVKLWDDLGSAYPNISELSLAERASAIDESLCAHRVELGDEVFQHVRRAFQVMREPSVFFQILSGVYRAVERLLRYRDLIVLGMELRERRAREANGRPMILAYIVRRRFLEKVLFY